VRRVGRGGKVPRCKRKKDFNQKKGFWGFAHRGRDGAKKTEGFMKEADKQTKGKRGGGLKPRPIKKGEKEVLLLEKKGKRIHKGGKKGKRERPSYLCTGRRESKEK